MRVVALVVTGLTCLVHGRRVQTPRSSLPRSSHEERKGLQRSVSRSGVSDHLKGLAKLLLALDNPTTGWQVIMQSRNLAAKSAIGRARCIYMQAVDQEEVKTDEQPTRRTAKETKDLEDMEEVKFGRPPATFPDTDLTVTHYPSPILRAPNKDITVFDDKLKKLSEDMFKVMYGCEGVGLAAPQVGLNLNMFVYNWQPQFEKMRAQCDIVVCNPKIVKYSPDTDCEPEGCLSVAGMVCRGNVRRALGVDVEYQDVEGNVRKESLSEFRARVFQHEMDHLNGCLIFDRYFPKERKVVQKYLDVLIDEHGPDGDLELDAEKRKELKPPGGEVEMNRITRRREQVMMEKLVTERKEKAAKIEAQKKGETPKPEKSLSGFGGGGGGAASKSKAKGKKKTKKKR